jgi:uncharacterized protein YkwD
MPKFFYAIVGILSITLFTGCAHLNSTAPEPAGVSAEAQIVVPANFDHALLARAIFEETNRVRLAHGVPPLARLPALDAAAEEQAFYMELALDAKHDNPIAGEHTTADRIAHAGLAPSAFGENVLMQSARDGVSPADPNYTYSSVAAACVNSWLGSPGHRENLLDPKFTHLGCAARLARVVSGETCVFAVQVFYRLPPKPVL